MPFNKMWKNKDVGSAFVVNQVLHFEVYNGCEMINTYSRGARNLGSIKKKNGDMLKRNKGQWEGVCRGQIWDILSNKILVVMHYHI